MLLSTLFSFFRLPNCISRFSYIFILFISRLASGGKELVSPLAQEDYKIRIGIKILHPAIQLMNQGSRLRISHVLYRLQL